MHLGDKIRLLLIRVIHVAIVLWIAVDIFITYFFAFNLSPEYHWFALSVDALIVLSGLLFSECILTIAEWFLLQKDEPGTPFRGFVVRLGEMMGISLSGKYASVLFYVVFIVQMLGHVIGLVKHNQFDGLFRRTTDWFNPRRRMICA